MPSNTPLTDAINALTQYANETTGASDTTLSDAVGTLVAGYGGGGSGWTTDGIADRSEPNGAITITTAVSSIKERAFQNCRGITSLTVEGSPYIENYAFSGCTGLTAINAPNWTRLYSNNYNASSYQFSGCTGLTSISFPAYGNYAIPSYAFQNCSNLTIADFGGGSGLQNSFQGCSSLRTLVLRRTGSITTLSAWSANTLGGIYQNPAASTIYVPSDLISSYQSASNWSSAYSAGVTFAAIEGSQYE